jgi:hypothetical protein
MATHKRSKKIRGKSKAKKKAARKTIAAPAKRPSRRVVSGKKVRPAAKKKRATKKIAAKEIRSPEPSTLSGRVFSTGPRRLGTGLASAGQAGDIQALPRDAVVDSESVEELVEEGQAREAAAVNGVEAALDPDQAEVHSREVPEDDVPEEYIDED